MDLTNVACLPYEKAAEITRSRAHAWLIESLWGRSACGIIGGQPKCCKSWFGLDMALSVASQTPCLGRFSVHERGPVLIFMAEDRLEDTKQRLTNIADARGVSLESLELYLITAPTLRLDNENDRQALLATIDRIQPKLMLLDPLVRLHRIDENSAKEVSQLLGFLRHIERTYGVAIVLTHHSSKKTRTRSGQMLRGSSDLHAFGDSNIYLARNGDAIQMTLEHRTAESLGPLALELVGAPHVHLRMKNSTEGNAQEKQEPSLEEKILEVLRKDSSGIARDALRKELRVNNAKLGQALQELKEKKIVISDATGIYLTSIESPQ